MLCLGCGIWAGDRLCDGCVRSLRRSPERHVGGVGVVRPAYVHEGAARRLVHCLKYRGVLAAAEPLAAGMTALVPVGVKLVPVPRVRWRLVRYGVDPALELAVALADASGLPVMRALVSPLTGRARAGGVHGGAPRFRLRRSPSDVPVVLVDDVVTSGATLRAAARLFPSVVGAVTATGTPGRGDLRGHIPEV